MGTICQNCGTENAEDAKFCKNCGAKIEVPSTLESNSGDAEIEELLDAVVGYLRTHPEKQRQLLEALAPGVDWDSILSLMPKKQTGPAPAGRKFNLRATLEALDRATGLKK